MSLGVAYKGDGDDPMHEVLSDFANHEVTVILKGSEPELDLREVATGILTWVDFDDEYQVNNTQFAKNQVDMLIVFE
jgi:hypothetical protein